MITLHYNSLAEFLAECTTAKKRHPYNPFVTEGNGFSGCSFDDAMQYASTGWPEGTGKVQALSANLTAKLTSLIEVPQLTYDVTGSDFDIGLYVSGRPECWYRMENNYQEGTGTNVLKMVYNIGARCNVSTKAMTARGVVAASLIALLEKCGRRLELVAVNRVDIPHQPFTADIRIPVKQADQELDIDRLSFILANPAMLRRLSFGVRSLRCEENGEGSSQDVPENEQGEIYFPAGVGELWEHPESAVAYIKSELVKQGVNIREQ